MTKVITRREYLRDSKKLHHKYYLQFATKKTYEIVKVNIGLYNILESKDERFNDIPLQRWDRLDEFIRLSINVKVKSESDGSPEGKYWWSLSDAVCIAKAVAKAIKEKELSK